MFLKVFNKTTGHRLQNNYVQIKFLTKALYPEYIFKTVKPNNNEASLIKT